MSNEVIHVRNGRATLSDAVVQVAQIFNPLGAAGPVIATLGGCATEIYRFKKADEELRRRHQLASGIVRTRQGVIIGLFEAQLRDAQHVRVSLSELHLAFRKITDAAVRSDVSDIHGEYAHATLRLLSGQIRGMHSDASRALIRLSDSLSVGDTRAAIAAWRALESR